jgi:hypothetical protein
MIKLKNVIGKNIQAEQTGLRPLIYLDNWAFNTFSINNNYRDRFVDIVNSLGGTLAISIVNLFEIVNRDDKDQILSICRLVDLIDGIFIDVNPNNVIQREKDFENIDSDLLPSSPCADTQLLMGYFLHVHNPLKIPKISDAILNLCGARQSDKNTIIDNFETELYPKIENARNDADMLEQAKRRYANKSYRIRTKYPYTADLNSRCIDFIVINENMKMPNKEWRDILHLIVPVSYCDYVCIDTRWESFIKSSGFEYPEIAKIYTSNTLDDFLNDLKGFKAN